jgi:hypothetical protein
MHTTLSTDAGGRRVVAAAYAAPRQLIRGQNLLIGIVVGTTWLAVIGGLLSYYILLGATQHSHLLTGYAAHNLLERAPTAFGTVAVSNAVMVPTQNGVQVEVSMQAVNDQDSQVAAPSVEELRLVDTAGDSITLGPARWQGPAFLVPHSSTTINLQYVVQYGAGLVWLEYRDPLGQWPTRVALGDAPVEAVQ